MEAVIPAEIRVGSHRIEAINKEHNEEMIRESPKIIKEKSLRSYTRAEHYKRHIQAAHNKIVRKREFQVRDLVLRQVDALKRVGKLQANWEGLYKVVMVYAGGSYELEDMEGRKSPRPSIVYHLKKFYIYPLPKFNWSAF